MADVPAAVAVAQALAWAVGFDVVTTAVHACKARALHQPSQRRLAGAAVLLALVGLVTAWERPEARPLAPMACAALVLAAAPIRLRHMKGVGWLLALASVVALAAQVYLFRK